MPYYEKAPLRLKAEQFRFIDGPDGDETRRLAQSLGLIQRYEVYRDGDFIDNSSPWEVQTLEGWVTVNDGDYVIIGIEGEKYPRSEEDFQKNYTKVEGEENLYERKPICVKAFQWWKNGDHPEDESELITGSDGEMFLSEGKIVRRFNHPNISSQEKCEVCDHVMGNHGWIDRGENGLRVCPGDMIIQTYGEEPYPCKPRIFIKTYYLLTFEQFPKPVGEDEDEFGTEGPISSEASEA